MTKSIKLFVVCILALASSTFGQAITGEQLKLVAEHAKFGVPSNDKVYIRKAYIMGFDPTRRIPSWVAFHVTSEYRKTPPRKARFATFRNDPDIDNEPATKEYVKAGFDRGHLAPYGIMGGDRNGDGKLADLDHEKSDEDDELTIKQGNYMSNITPQHKAFNEAGGVWFVLERWIQDKLTPKAKDVWVVAGCIHNGRTKEVIGPSEDIQVPPMFFQVVAIQQDGTDVPLVLAFIFPHYRKKGQSIEDYLTTVDTIESATGLDLFNKLSEQKQDALERQGTWKNWPTFVKMAGEP
jgi:endonuclease G, mitochondrial